MNCIVVIDAWKYCEQEDLYSNIIKKHSANYMYSYNKGFENYNV
jgi:hypothetical protein